MCLPVKDLLGTYIIPHFHCEFKRISQSSQRWFWERRYALLTAYLALHIDALLLVLHVEAPGELLDEAAAA
jgi:hypothetical protein